MVSAGVTKRYLVQSFDEMDFRLARQLNVRLFRRGIASTVIYNIIDVPS